MKQIKVMYKNGTDLLSISTSKSFKNIAGQIKGLYFNDEKELILVVDDKFNQSSLKNRIFEDSGIIMSSKPENVINSNNKKVESRGKLDSRSDKTESKLETGKGLFELFTPTKKVCDDRKYPFTVFKMPQKVYDELYRYLNLEHEGKLLEYRRRMIQEFIELVERGFQGKVLTGPAYVWYSFETNVYTVYFRYDTDMVQGIQWYEANIKVIQKSSKLQVIKEAAIGLGKSMGDTYQKYGLMKW